MEGERGVLLPVSTLSSLSPSLAHTCSHTPGRSLHTSHSSPHIPFPTFPLPSLEELADAPPPFGHSLTPHTSPHSLPLFPAQALRSLVAVLEELADAPPPSGHSHTLAMLRYLEESMTVGGASSPPPPPPEKKEQGGRKRKVGRKYKGRSGNARWEESTRGGVEMQGGKKVHMEEWKWKVGREYKGRSGTARGVCCCTRPSEGSGIVLVQGCEVISSPAPLSSHPPHPLALSGQGQGEEVGEA